MNGTLCQVAHSSISRFLVRFVNIIFSDDNLSIYNQMRNPKLKPSSEIFYDEVALVLEKNKHKWAALVDWVADAFNDMLDGVPNVSFPCLNYT
jgi:hypothetical protein